MLFSSMIFLWVFLPIVLVLYYLARSTLVRNGILLIASLIFYAWGEPVYVFLLMGVVLVNYFFGRILEGRKSKLLLALVVAINLLILGYYKYFNFAASLINRATSRQWIATREILLPLGISFFIFQSLSYVIDVYRDETEAQRSYFRLLLYVAMFPQLIAGPIVKYHDVAAQLQERSYTWDQRAEGVRRFIYGLSKKVLLSNSLAIFADEVLDRSFSDFSSGALWLGALFYTFQIFFDFSGYSDMAIGLGHLFGFTFKENFRAPYTAHSIREFWRRWHISLSTWFRDYVYIPLGGSRHSSSTTFRNLMIVFFLTGLWHGASMNFIFWGLYYGVFLILERVFLGKFLERGAGRIIGHAYTFFVVVIGWVIFRVEGGMSKVIEYISGMLRIRAGHYTATDMLGGKGFILLALSAFFAIALPLLAQRRAARNGNGTEEIRGTKTMGKEGHRGRVMGVRGIPEAVVLFILLALCVIQLVSATYNPFIYFRF